MEAFVEYVCSATEPETGDDEVVKVATSHGALVDL